MGYITKIKINNNSALSLASSLFGTCATAAATAAKVVTCSEFNQLVTGVTIHVKFTNANTAVNPTLNVNGTGAKSIKMSSSWNAGDVVPFTYDGSNWFMHGSGAVDTSALAPKANPVFTGTITLGNTTMTEQNLIDMLDILAELQPAAGVSF
jgi:hypothetical protein